MHATSTPSPSPRSLVLPLVGMAVLAAGSGLAVQGLSLRSVMRIIGPEIMLIYGVGAVLALRRSRRAPSEAAGWRWLAVSSLASVLQGLLVALVPWLPWLEAGRNSLWIVLALLHQGAGVAAFACWPWRIRKAGQRALHILGSILFCGSLLLVMRCLINWDPLQGQARLLDAVLRTSCLRVAVFGGLSMYLLADRPARWRGVLGWIFLNAVGGGFFLAMLYPFWVRGVAWMQTPLFMVALSAGMLLAMAAYDERPVEPGAGPERELSRLWEFLPYLAFVSAAVMTVSHFLVRPAQARADVLFLVLLLVPLLWRQILLYREVRSANLNLEARVELRTRDLEATRTQLLQEIAVRRNSEEALKLAFAAVEQSASSIVITDREGSIQYLNPAYTAASGYSPRELMGQNHRVLKSGQHDEAFYRQLWASLLDGNTWRGRFHNRNKAGQLYWEQAVISPVRDAEGQVTHFVAAKENITEALKLEEEHLRLEQQMLHAQKLESLGSLAGGVAHDMNNVLGAILAIASSRLEQMGEDQGMRKTLDTIAKAASRGGEMVRSLLSFARQTPAEEREVDLNAVLQEAAQLLKWTTLARIRTVLDLSPGLRPMRGDAGALTHSIMNLCINSVDAMPAEGTLTLLTRNTADGEVEVQVRDTGSGMTEEVKRRALDPFFTTKPQGKGTGLGLAMVYSVVKAHRGSLELQSEPGQGTCVTLRFPPVVPAEPGAGSQPTAPAVPAGRALDLLVVDDDELMAGATQELLGMLGHAVKVVSRGEEALAVLETGRSFDGVILDVNMPGLGGVETLHRLRGLRPSLPVVLVTGKADQGVVDLVAGYPGVGLLAKPYNLPQLREQLQAWS